jgi:hypothetical protein
VGKEEVPILGGSVSGFWQLLTATADPSAALRFAQDDSGQGVETAECAFGKPLADGGPTRKAAGHAIGKPKLRAANVSAPGGKRTVLRLPQDVPSKTIGCVAVRIGV